MHVTTGQGGGFLGRGSRRPLVICIMSCFETRLDRCTICDPLKCFHVLNDFIVRRDLGLRGNGWGQEIGSFRRQRTGG